MAKAWGPIPEKALKGQAKSHHVRYYSYRFWSRYKAGTNSIKLGTALGN
jgi:hypothetical protein